MANLFEFIPGVVGAVASYFGNRETNDTNKALTRETNAQNERLMREQWAREDNAISRRAADLQSAGLSKTLAAGSSASAGSLATMEKPDYSNSTQAALDSAYKMMSMAQDFQRRQKENELLSSQINNINVRTAGDTISNSIKNYQLTKMLPIDRDIKLSIYRNNMATYASVLYNLSTFGSSKGPSSVVKPLFDLSNAASGFMSELYNGATNILEDIGKRYNKNWHFKKMYHNPAEHIFYNSINNLGF